MNYIDKPCNFENSKSKTQNYKKIIQTQRKHQNVNPNFNTKIKLKKY